MSVENRVPSVRKQKIKKNHTKTRLIIFLILALALLLVAVFAQQALPLMIQMHRIPPCHCARQVRHILPEQTGLAGICFHVFCRASDKWVFGNTFSGSDYHGDWNCGRRLMRLLWRYLGLCNHAYFRYMSGISGFGFCACYCSIIKRRAT